MALIKKGQFFMAIKFELLELCPPYLQFIYKVTKNMYLHKSIDYRINIRLKEKSI